MRLTTVPNTRGAVESTQACADQGRSKKIRWAWSGELVKSGLGDGRL